MTYTVVWKPRPKRHLADLWIAAADRAAFTRAVDEVDLGSALHRLTKENREKAIFEYFSSPPSVLNIESSRMIV